MNASHRRPATAHASTAEGLLALARFGVPGVSRSHVSRRRLLDALDGTANCPLVLVTGPAGSGKTALVAEWVRSSGDQPTTGWVTFEAGETAFWEHVVECLRRLGLVAPGLLTGSGELLIGRNRVMDLAAALAADDRAWTLVLDGYEMSSVPLARELDLLLRHARDSLRVVFVARVDPVLPLYRYRLEDEVQEIRSADLAFLDDEAAALLRRLGVSLGRDSVHSLTEKVRGWVSGLRFAARTLAAREEPERAVGTVLAQGGDINEYLVGEVLDTLQADVRRLVLETSVPDLFCPDLVLELGGPDAVETLSVLTRSNAFMEGVPDEPGFYRYYPFFRDLLRARLAYEDPEAMAELRRRAARWFRRTGIVDESLPHPAEIRAREDAGRSSARELGYLVEPLTVRELEVLGLLAELLTTEEIAERLFVSVNTVRTHIRSVLRKLGVNRRNAAVRRAREIGILEDGPVVIPVG